MQGMQLKKYKYITLLHWELKKRVLIDSQSIFEDNAGLSEKKNIQLKKIYAFSHKTHTQTCNMLFHTTTAT